MSVPPTACAVGYILSPLPRLRSGRRYRGRDPVAASAAEVRPPLPRLRSGRRYRG